MLVQLASDAYSRVSEQDILPPSAWGMTRPTNRARWNTAFRLYARDQISEALEVGSSAAAGERGEFVESLQIIDAEARTSSLSEITRINEWLEVEVISSEHSMSAAALGLEAEHAIRNVWSKIGLKVGSNTLVTILASDVVLPLHLDARGYITLKRPYAKYCVPAAAVTDPATLGLELQRHAGLHAAAIISSSSAPPWLLCASQAVTEWTPSNEVRYSFCSGGATWREPHQLNLMLKGHGLDREGSEVLLEQANLVGRYLIDKGGIKAFRDCLSYHSPASIIHYFVLLFSNDPTRDGCKKYFGFAPEYLFEQALASCCK